MRRRLDWSEGQIGKAANAAAICPESEGKQLSDHTPSELGIAT